LASFFGQDTTAASLMVTEIDACGICLHCKKGLANKEMSSKFHVCEKYDQES